MLTGMTSVAEPMPISPGLGTWASGRGLLPGRGLHGHEEMSWTLTSHGGPGQEKTNHVQVDALSDRGLPVAVRCHGMGVAKMVDPALTPWPWCSMSRSVAT